MKISISNICWEGKNDDAMFRFLHDHNISMEVAPDRVFKWELSELTGRLVSPFEKHEEAENWHRIVNLHYGIVVSSMHSLLFNIGENIFVSAVYRRYLTDYIKRAIDFAVKIKCPNVSFGCGVNRNIPDKMSKEKANVIAENFFGELADYAEANGVYFSIEPVPVSEKTNFLNYTQEAFDFVKKLNKPNLKVTVDLGTVIENKEKIEDIFTKENMELISHVVISEPKLMPIRKRDMFADSIRMLKNLGYDKYVSIKMLKFPEIKLLQGVINYFNMLINE